MYSLSEKESADQLLSAKSVFHPNRRENGTSSRAEYRRINSGLNTRAWRGNSSTPQLLTVSSWAASFAAKDLCNSLAAPAQRRSS